MKQIFECKNEGLKKVLFFCFWDKSCKIMDFFLQQKLWEYFNCHCLWIKLQFMLIAIYIVNCLAYFNFSLFFHCFPERGWQWTDMFQICIIKDSYIYANENIGQIKEHFFLLLKPSHYVLTFIHSHQLYSSMFFTQWIDLFLLFLIVFVLFKTV